MVCNQFSLALEETFLAGKHSFWSNCQSVAEQLSYSRSWLYFWKQGCWQNSVNSSYLSFLSLLMKCCVIQLKLQGLLLFYSELWSPCIYCFVTAVQTAYVSEITPSEKPLIQMWERFKLTCSLFLFQHTWVLVCSWEFRCCLVPSQNLCCWHPRDPGWVSRAHSRSLTWCWISHVGFFW